MTARIEEAVAAIAAGRLIVVVDDEERENEGDLVMAASAATPETVNFMLVHGRGLLCVPLTPERVSALGLPPIVSPGHGGDRQGTAFTVPVDVRRGTTTGISAADRAATVRALVDPATRPDDLMRPGHVFPLAARPGGVLKRAGHTEAAVDFARLAGLAPAGVICEILRPDGSMARMPDLTEFAAAHGLPIVTIRDLIEHRRRTERLVRPLQEVRLPTRVGDFRLVAYGTTIDDTLHVALTMGDLRADAPTLVRVHSECLTGDVFGSRRCDCGEQMDAALRKIADEGRGVLLYMRQEGRGIGLLGKLHAYAIQEEGVDTVEANTLLGFKPDLREYGIGAQILCDLGLRKIRLMTNNPTKIVGLGGYGLEIVERIPLEVRPNPENERYLQAKGEKLGHLLKLIK